MKGHLSDRVEGLANGNSLDNQKHLKDIIAHTIHAVDQSKTQIYGIVEKNRTEYELMKRDLEQIRLQADKIINDVDALETKDKLMRQKLAEMSKNFNRYSEAEVKLFYESASEIRIQFMAKQNEEKLLIERRKQLELSLRRFSSAIEDAEKVIHQISIALGFLQGEISTAIEGLSGADNLAIGIRILEAQEAERKRLARDIHDGPAQTMANVIMKADLCQMVLKRDIEKGYLELNELKSMVHASLKEVRNIIFDLRPMTLDDLGFNSTLERYADKMKHEHNLQFQVTIKNAKFEMDPIFSIGMYRILQEIVNNAVRHAKPTWINLSLEYGQKFVRLILIHDGKGFDVEKTLEKVTLEGGHYGLLGMHERATHLGGTLKIESDGVIGANYTLVLPLNREVLSHERND